jgi:hypothetical protein
LLGLVVLTTVGLATDQIGKKHHTAREKSTDRVPEMLWREPTDISSRNLRFGPGGRSHQPPASGYTFVKEQTAGSTPKFVIEDNNHVHWKVKLGPEARPEVVATRLVWAVGYFTDEDYFMRELRISDMPRLKRGGELVGTNGVVRNARLERVLPEAKKVREWKWKDDTYYQTQQWNGLRVMMALINNWDLKDENNAVYRGRDRNLHVVSDLGASFGPTGPGVRGSRASGNLDTYQHSHFITKVTDEYVDFATPGCPSLLYMFNPKAMSHRVHYRWIGHRVPVEDVQWITARLSRLSPRQIRDAFAAADYPPDKVEGFAVIVEARIAQLKAL